MVRPHTSKPADCWRTPAWLCEALGPFDLDPCSGPGSHVAATRTYDERRGENGLTLAWDVVSYTSDDVEFIPASVFVNPPYSAPGPWCARLRGHGGPWVALVKLDPTTRWWADLMAAGPAWAAFRKRLTFEPPAQGWEGASGMTARFPCALVYKGWSPPVSLSPQLWLDGRLSDD